MFGVRGVVFKGWNKTNQNCIWWHPLDIVWKVIYFSHHWPRTYLGIKPNSFEVHDKVLLLWHKFVLQLIEAVLYHKMMHQVHKIFLILNGILLQESINRSLLNLLTYPWIEEKVKNGILSVHGGYYDFVDCTFEKWTLDYKEDNLKEKHGRISVKNHLFWSWFHVWPCCILFLI